MLKGEERMVGVLWEREDESFWPLFNSVLAKLKTYKEIPV
jgi:hypothetical protein